MILDRKGKTITFTKLQIRFGCGAVSWQRTGKLHTIQPSKILCFFGFHDYEERLWKPAPMPQIWERVCKRCGNNPTWDR